MTTAAVRGRESGFPATAERGRKREGERLSWDIGPVSLLTCSPFHHVAGRQTATPLTTLLPTNRLFDVCYVLNG